MCDTIVALGNATADGTVILAKNSDRQPNEAQALVHIPRSRHEAGTMVKCTYIAQAAEMYERYRGAPIEERAEPLAAFTATCFERASRATEGWIERVSATEMKRRPSGLYRLAWRKFDEQAGISRR